METLGTVRDHLGGYLNKQAEKLSAEKQKMAEKISSAGLSRFREQIMKTVDVEVEARMKQFAENQVKLSEVMDTGKIHAFQGKDIEGGKRIVGMHDHQKEKTAIDAQMLERAMESGNMAEIKHIENHEGIHEKYPGPNVYVQDPEILQKTLAGLYEGWTEKTNRIDLKDKIALEAYPEERELLENTVGRAGNTAHLEKALKEKDTFKARVLLLHSLKHTRPDLLGGYDPTFEFQLYADKQNRIQNIQTR